MLVAQERDSSWQLQEQQDSIRVYVRDVPGSNFQAFRAETTIEARLQTLAAVLDDVEHADEWIHFTEKGIMIERIDRETAVVSLLTDLPWPASDRDSVTYNTLTQDPETLTVRYTFDARADAYPERDDYIRIQDISGYWELRPTVAGKVQVIYTTQSDPGGTVPAWLINLVITRQPLETIRNLREIVQQPRYSDAKMPGIREPE